MTSKIIVGVDGSEHSARAVAWCADHADGFGAEVVAVHVIDTPPYTGYGMTGISVPAVADEDRDAIRDVAVRDWCKRLADAGVQHRVVLMDGNPALALVRAARAERAELVVVGRRGRGGFAELVLGSTSHELTHQCGVPLVIVP